MYNFYRDFTNSINPDYNIWQCYHNERFIQRYNLKENYEIRLFNTNNVGYAGKSLNHLNKFFSEGCCLLYPWLNNLQSYNIGFMHYRRTFNTNMNVMAQKLIAQRHIQYFHYSNPNDEIKKHKEEYGIADFDYKTPYKNIENHCFFWSMDKCGIMDDLIEFLQTQYPQYLEGEKKIHRMIWACIFVCRYELYEELAKLIYDYISFINNKYQLYWSEENWKNHVYHKFLEYNQLHHPKSPDHIECRRVESDRSVWCELPFWGEQGWTNCSYHNGYISSINTRTNLYRVYAYNIEFLVSVFIYNHLSYIDMNNVLMFTEENGNKYPIPFDKNEY